MQNFKPFRENLFFRPNRHLAWFCTHPFNYMIILFCFANAVCPLGNFIVVCSVTIPLNGSEDAGDLVLIQTSLRLLHKSSCSYAN